MRVTDLTDQLAAAREALSAANERRAALESELQRLPEIERRHEVAENSLTESAATASSLRAKHSRLTAELAAELAAERDNLCALRARFQETHCRLESQNATVSALSIELDVAILADENDRKPIGRQMVTLTQDGGRIVHAADRAAGDCNCRDITLGRTLPMSEHALLSNQPVIMSIGRAIQHDSALAAQGSIISA